MGSWSDFLKDIYKKEMDPYLDGRPEHLDYVEKEDYHLKLKVLESAISNVMENNWNPYVHGKYHADARFALRKMGWKKIFEIYERFSKTTDPKIVYCEAFKFGEILSKYNIWQHIDVPQIPFKEKLKKKCEPRFEEVGKSVRRLSWKNYAQYISIFSDVYDRFPAPHRLYYMIGLSIIKPKQLIQLNKQYGPEILADSIIDWGKQQQNMIQDKTEKKDLLYGIMNAALMAAGTGGAIHSKVSPFITSCMAGIAGLLTFHALVKYHKGQKDINKRKVEQRFFSESPEIIDVKKKIDQGLYLKNKRLSTR